MYTRLGKAKEGEASLFSGKKSNMFTVNKPGPAFGQEHADQDEGKDNREEEKEEEEEKEDEESEVKCLMSNGKLGEQGMKGKTEVERERAQCNT